MFAKFCTEKRTCESKSYERTHTGGPRIRQLFIYKFRIVLQTFAEAFRILYAAHNRFNAITNIKRVQAVRNDYEIYIRAM